MSAREICRLRVRVASRSGSRRSARPIGQRSLNYTEGFGSDVPVVEARGIDHHVRGEHGQTRRHLRGLDNPDRLDTPSVCCVDLARAESSVA
jgi:hypothetical protein